MGTRNALIDRYISRSAGFAQPLLRHLRALVHRGCPGVKETVKWGFPHFEYHGILCSMAAFKEHCAFGFWKASAMRDPAKILSVRGRTSMGHLGRITKLSDLPPERTIIGFIREAARLNAEGIKVPRRPVVRKKPPRTPGFLSIALRKNPRAAASFKNFTPSHRREYIEWLTEAKTPETRQRRLEQALAWMAEGRPRNWKYRR